MDDGSYAVLQHGVRVRDKAYTGIGARRVWICRMKKTCISVVVCSSTI